MTDAGPGMQPTEAVVERGRSIAPQVIVIAAAAGLLSALAAVAAMGDPEAVTRDEVTALNCVTSIIFALAHAMWISLDCRRRGVEVGWWRFAAIFLGPLAVWVYLATSYGARAALWIPLSIVVYVSVLLAPGLTYLAIVAIR
jgi:hypothetical protein